MSCEFRGLTNVVQDRRAVKECIGIKGGIGIVISHELMIEKSSGRYKSPTYELEISENNNEDVLEVIQNRKH